MAFPSVQSSGYIGWLKVRLASRARALVYNLHDKVTLLKLSRSMPWSEEDTEESYTCLRELPGL